MTEVTLTEASEAIGRMVRNHSLKVEEILRNHGAKINAKAAILTPVDTGFLRAANKYIIEATRTTVSLTMENRMIYARYQHDIPHKHTQPGKTDHFISRPFEAEIPAIIADIIAADMKEVTT